MEDSGIFSQFADDADALTGAKAGIVTVRNALAAYGYSAEVAEPGDISDTAEFLRGEAEKTGAFGVASGENSVTVSYPDGSELSLSSENGVWVLGGKTRTEDGNIPLSAEGSPAYYIFAVLALFSDVPDFSVFRYLLSGENGRTAFFSSRAAKEHFYAARDAAVAAGKISRYSFVSSPVSGTVVSDGSEVSLCDRLGNSENRDSAVYDPLFLAVSERKRGAGFFSRAGIKISRTPGSAAAAAAGFASGLGFRAAAFGNADGYTLTSGDGSCSLSLFGAAAGADTGTVYVSASFCGSTAGTVDPSVFVPVCGSDGTDGYTFAETCRIIGACAGGLRCPYIVRTPKVSSGHSDRYFADFRTALCSPDGFFAVAGGTACRTVYADSAECLAYAVDTSGTNICLAGTVPKIMSHCAESIKNSGNTAR